MGDLRETRFQDQTEKSVGQSKNADFVWRLIVAFTLLLAGFGLGMSYTWKKDKSVLDKWQEVARQQSTTVDSCIDKLRQSTQRIRDYETAIATLRAYKEREP